MNFRRIHPNISNPRKMCPKVVFQLLLLAYTTSLVISAIGIQDQYVLSSLENQTIQSDHQTASTNENVRAGSFGEDRISGADSDDIIIGLLGSDTIYGGECNDKIQGNEDSDKMYGDLGNDILQGGIGSDQIYGREDDDVLVEASMMTI